MIQKTRRKRSPRDAASRQKPRVNAYHRDDLKGELVSAARAHVVAHGHADLSVRKMAQAVRVSPGAPYHHFSDRRSLLLAVALRGYAEMTSLGRLAPRGVADASERLFRELRAFLGFAAENPRLFLLMYESELTQPEVDPEIAAAQQVGYDLLRETIIQARGSRKTPDLGIRIASVWSCIYGFALLRVRQMMRPHDEIEDPFAEATADAIVRRAIRLIAD